MRVRVVKLDTGVYIPQVFKKTIYGDIGWEALEIKTSGIFFTKCVGYETWNLSDCVIRYCAVSTLEQAMNKFKLLKAYLIKQEGERHLPNLYKKGNFTVVYEGEV